MPADTCTDETSDADFCATLQLVLPDAEEMDVTEWLQADENDLSYTHLNDQDIIEFVANCEQDEDAASDDNNNDCEEGQEFEPCQVSHVEAFACENKLLTWLKNQDECNVYNYNVLHGLCEIAEKNSMKQTLITLFKSQCMGVSKRCAGL